jgi:transglutaminase-like putative cysteine protease
MIYRVRHTNTVSYAAAVSQARFNLRLIPWTWQGQDLCEHMLTITPQPGRRDDITGPYCINTTQLSFAAPLNTLSVTSEFTVAIAAPPVASDDPPVEQLRKAAYLVKDLSAMSPVPYLFASRIAGIDQDIGAWAEPFIDPAAGIIATASAVMRAIHREFAYRPGTTTSSTPPEEAFAARNGVCQDFAHVMIMALRAHGIPAAYVSGYLRTLPPPGQARLVGADAMHAWVNVWCGETLGWIGFDPTNDCLARSDHIVIGMGRDYADVSPIDGTFIGNTPQTMISAVDVMLIE